MRIAFISCTNKKKDYECEAREMYSESTLFTLTLRYCKQQKFDKIYILSAKYGVLKLDTKIKPYQHTLNKMKIDDKINWGMKISEWIKHNLCNKDELYIFAGKNYHHYLNVNNKIVLPFGNMRIGERLNYLYNNINNYED